MPQGFYDAEMSRKQEALAATPDMQAQRRVILDHLALKPGEAVLDIGSGNGIMARDMLGIVGRSGSVTGLDAAEPMIAMARALCPGGKFVRGDACELPFDDCSFDAVTAAQLLCFLPDPDAALREMRRVLRPDGRLVILDTDWGSLVWNARDPDLMAKAMRIYIRPYADAYLPRTLSRRLRAAGFAVTVRETLTVLNWTPGPDNYAQLTASFMESITAAAADFSDEDWRCWQEDQKAVAEAGDYMFSLNRYIFDARPV
ncbi:methyltransferase domain-containing protein [Ruegeria sp. WL0004]|uniref:Methyltransferase domain-containing protein n=1 Tax=Ruegeria marisflavi TaxID=2984152 RepID=A0ABT2WSZ2_9RHOB|nr:methyltransferase domain-containing protein [Ruegeria sp. WL0004]MCU9839024.1 methyltransferase domain-containing protein [Ruegeria sp. WL0004]